MIFVFFYFWFCFFVLFFFFFSSRRRHTRLTCDWSSDVCSSDLDLRRLDARPGLPALPRRSADPGGGGEREPRLADRHPVRAARRPRPGLRSAPAFLELYRPLARRPLDAAGHRHLPERRRLRAARERRALPRPLACEFRHRPMA